MRTLFFRLLVLFCLLLVLARVGQFLVVNDPHSADVMVVLAGETDKRPSLALDLLRQGMAKKMILDVPAEAKLFQLSELEVARQYIQSLPESSAITACPVYGLSTKAETLDVARCLRDIPAKNILLVTSDYHTRRALSTFEKQLPAYNFSIAAAVDPKEFGTQWWRRREWAKTCLYEWVRLAWWECVDRW